MLTVDKLNYKHIYLVKMDNNLVNSVNLPYNPNIAIPTTKNKHTSLVAPLIVLSTSLLEEYLRKPFINSPLPKAIMLLLLSARSIFSPPLDIQWDFNKVLSGINNLIIDTTRVITIGNNAAAINLANSNIDSVDLLQDFTLDNIKPIVEVLDTKEGKNTNITKNLPKLAKFYNLSP